MGVVYYKAYSFYSIDASLRPYFCLDAKVGKRSRHTNRDPYGLLLIVESTKLTPCPKGSPSFADEIIVNDSLNYTSTRSLCVVFISISLLIASYFMRLLEKYHH